MAELCKPEKQQILNRKIDLLTKEWELCNSNIGRFDTLLFIVRGWSVALATGIIGFAYTSGDAIVCYLSIIPLFLFWAIDALFKSFQRKFISRTREIENYLSSDQFTSDIKDSSLSFASPLMSSKFGGGRFRDRTLLVIKAGLLRNVILSYFPAIAIVLMLGIAMQFGILGGDGNAP